MAWWGKVLGGTLGFMIGGPLGALIGATFGHNFDRGLDSLDRPALGADGFSDQERTQTAFFTTTFSVMGHLAKADGQVTKDELQLADDLMVQMQLPLAQRKVAQRLFTEGKSADFPLDDVLDQFRHECHRSRNLIQMFIEIQLHAAYVDGVVHPAERNLINHICERLGISPGRLQLIEQLVLAQHQHRQSGHGFGDATQQGPTLSGAYAILGVTENSSDQEVKRAYRRLMSQHHPDKLVAKGLPEEMMELATQKTQEIRAAYEQVKAARDL